MKHSKSIFFVLFEHCVCIQVLKYIFDLSLSLSPSIYMVLLMIILDYFARPQNATWSHNKNKVWNWLTETMYLHIRLLVIIRISCSDYKRKTFLYPTKVKYLVSFLTWIMSKNETYQSSNAPKSKIEKSLKCPPPTVDKNTISRKITI